MEIKVRSVSDFCSTNFKALNNEMFSFTVDVLLHKITRNKLLYSLQWRKIIPLQAGHERQK